MAIKKSRITTLIWVGDRLLFQKDFRISLLRFTEVVDEYEVVCLQFVFIFPKYFIAF